MPRPTFNREAFQQANQAAQQQGEFAQIEKGIYIASIERAEMKETTNGAYQAVFGWQISEEDENYANQYVWWNQTLVNTDGTMNNIGLQVLNQVYYSLSEGQFDPDHFQYDEAGEVTNDDEIHERFFGSVAKIQVIPNGEYNGNPQYKVKVKGVITNKYQEHLGGLDEPEESALSEQAEALGNTTEQPVADAIDAEGNGEDTEYDLYINAPVIAEMPDGKVKHGRILGFVEDGQGGGIIRIQPTALSDATFKTHIQKPIMVKDDQVSLVLGLEPHPQRS